MTRMDRKAIYLEHMQNESGALNEAQQPPDYEADFKTLEDAAAGIEKFVKSKGYKLQGEIPLKYRRDYFRHYGDGATFDQSLCNARDGQPANAIVRYNVKYYPDIITFPRSGDFVRTPNEKPFTVQIKIGNIRTVGALATTLGW